MIITLAPSKPSKHPSRLPRPSSPTQHRGSSDSLAPSSLVALGGGGPPPLVVTSKKTGAMPPVPVTKAGMGLVEKIQPLSFVLQPPEEQTDNWDDDFEEGISFTKLQGEIYMLSCYCKSNIGFKSDGKDYYGRR